MPKAQNVQEDPLTEIAAQKVRDEQNVQEDPLAEIASDFAFDPESFMSSFNKDAKQARDELILELLDAGELSNRAIAEEVGCDKNTVTRLQKASGAKMPSAQTHHNEDPLADIASDFAFDPESFMSEVDALADEEFEPEIILPNDEDKYFEVKPLVNVGLETKKVYKTGDDRYSFKKEADQMVAAFPPEVQANASFASINRAFQDWTHEEAVTCFKVMSESLPDQLRTSLDSLRKMLSALEEAGITSFVETEINNEPVAANSELPIIETAS